MAIIVLNNENVWASNELFVQSINKELKIGDSVGGIEILDIPIILSQKSCYLLRLATNHNYKRNETITD